MNSLTRLRFLDKGVDMNLRTLTQDDKPDQDLDATFLESLTDEVEFVVACSAPDALFMPDGKPKYVKINFERHNLIHAFTAKSMEMTERDGAPAVCLKQISPIETVSRRQSPRHELKAVMDVYPKFEPDANGVYAFDRHESLYTGPVFDISGEGVCFLTNRLLDIEKGQTYVLHIVLASELEGLKGSDFTFSARVTRKGDAPQSVQFKYDYGFLFDLNQRQDERSRLITAIFKQKKGFSEKRA